MRFFVDRNFVETDAKVYEFSTSAQAENFINCLMAENEVYCSLIVRPLKIHPKPSVLPFTFWGKLHRFVRYLPTRFNLQDKQHAG